MLSFSLHFTAIFFNDFHINTDETKRTYVKSGSVTDSDIQAASNREKGRISLGSEAS
jgi:hypothetical protein